MVRESASRERRERGLKKKDKRMYARGKKTEAGGRERGGRGGGSGWQRDTRGSCQRFHRERERERKEEREREKDRRPSPPIVTIEVASLNCRLRAFNSRSKDRNDPSVPSRHWPLFPTSKLLLNSSLPRSRRSTSQPLWMHRGLVSPLPSLFSIRDRPTTLPLYRVCDADASHKTNSGVA